MAHIFVNETERLDIVHTEEHIGRNGRHIYFHFDRSMHRSLVRAGRWRVPRPGVVRPRSRIGVDGGSTWIDSRHATQYDAA